MGRQEPTGRELEALKVLWARGGATVREVHEAMLAQEGAGDLAYTTVLSLLQTMEQKGLVAHDSGGKAYRYHARVKRETVFRRLAAGFLDRVFDGALGEYVARALESRAPSLAELEDLERRIAQAKREIAGRPAQRGKP
jgi:predicted transcriptional regulator